MEGAEIGPELKMTIIEIVDERIRHSGVTREDFRELKSIVKELAQAQKASEERLGRVEFAVEELAQAQKRTEQEVRKLAVGLRETRQMVGGLSDTVGYRLEDESYKALPALLKRDFNIDLEGRLIRKYIEYPDGRHDEINIYGKSKKDGKHVWILGECKSKLSKRDVDRFLKMIKRTDDFLPGEKILVASTYNMEPKVERYAREKGIQVYWSYEF